MTIVSVGDGHDVPAAADVVDDGAVVALELGELPPGAADDDALLLADGLVPEPAGLGLAELLVPGSGASVTVGSVAGLASGSVLAVAVAVGLDPGAGAVVWDGVAARACRGVRGQRGGRGVALTEDLTDGEQVTGSDLDAGEGLVGAERDPHDDAARGLVEGAGHPDAARCSPCRRRTG